MYHTSLQQSQLLLSQHQIHTLTLPHSVSLGLPVHSEHTAAPLVYLTNTPSKAHTSREVSSGVFYFCWAKVPGRRDFILFSRSGNGPATQFRRIEL